MAWLLKIETDSILIKEKRKHLSKTLDRVSKLMKRKRLKFGLRESSHRSIYQYTKLIRYRIIINKNFQGIKFQFWFHFTLFGLINEFNLLLKSHTSATYYVE